MVRRISVLYSKLRKSCLLFLNPEWGWNKLSHKYGKTKNYFHQLSCGNSLKNVLWSFSGFINYGKWNTGYSKILSDKVQLNPSPYSWLFFSGLFFLLLPMNLPITLSLIVVVALHICLWPFTNLSLISKVLGDPIFWKVLLEHNPAEHVVGQMVH